MRRTDDGVEVTFQHRDGRLDISHYVFSNISFVDALLCAWAMFSETLRMYDTLPDTLKSHPCFITKSIGDDNVYVDVREEYFEKQRLALWSVDRLATVARNGAYEREHFRRSFIPFLSKIIEQLSVPRAASSESEASPENSLHAWMVNRPP